MKFRETLDAASIDDGVSQLNDVIERWIVDTWKGTRNQTDKDWEKCVDTLEVNYTCDKKSPNGRIEIYCLNHKDVLVVTFNGVTATDVFFKYMTPADSDSK